MLNPEPVLDAVAADSLGDIPIHRQMHRDRRR
jgi:hypothetical protein